MGRENLELLRGTFGLLLMKALSGEPRHGHDIMKWLRTVTDGTFLVEEGAIYPALHRLERQKLLVAEWRRTENNRRAKYYRLSDRGRKELESEREKWTRYVHTVDKVLGSSSA